MTFNSKIIILKVSQTGKEKEGSKENGFTSLVSITPNEKRIEEHL